MKEFVIAMVFGIVVFWFVKVAHNNSSDRGREYLWSALIFGPAIATVVLILLGFQFHY